MDASPLCASQGQLQTVQAFLKSSKDQLGAILQQPVGRFTHYLRSWDDGDDVLKHILRWLPHIAVDQAKETHSAIFESLLN